MPVESEEYEVEPESDIASGVCECCGKLSRQLTGFIQRGESTVAGYSIHWTVGHHPDKPANIDLVIGRWEEAAGPDQRYVVSLLLYEREGPPEVLVIDAADRPITKGGLADVALARGEVIGTPRAQEVFSLVDAIFLQDARLSMLDGPGPGR